MVEFRKCKKKRGHFKKLFCKRELKLVPYPALTLSVFTKIVCVKARTVSRDTSSRSHTEILIQTNKGINKEYKVGTEQVAGTEKLSGLEQPFGCKWLGRSKNILSRLFW